jgi:hypothetical protein
VSAETNARKGVPGRSLVIACLLSAALNAGCSSFVTHGEYTAYRDVRLAEDEHEKLVSAGAYLEKFPDGEWARELHSYRRAADERIWQAGRTSRDGLEYYLEVFPNGAHAAEARPRVEALRAVDERRTGETQNAAAVQDKRRLDAREEKRTWLGRAVEFWSRTFVGVQNWGAPIADVALRNAGFNKAFGRSPKPRCSKTECVKFYAATFGIPVPGSTRIERRLELLLRLKLKDGNLVRAELLLPGRGFSRWYEHENRTPVIDEDPAQRAQAINWALDRVVPALEATLTGATREDVIPEPIEAPKLRAPNAPEVIEDPEGKGAATAPNEAPEATATAAGAPAAPGTATAEAPSAAATGEAGLDGLLKKAAGEAELEAAPAETPSSETVPAAVPETLVIPASLYALKTASLRAVVFSAPDDDQGAAYDGLYFELLAAPSSDATTTNKPKPKKTQATTGQPATPKPQAPSPPVKKAPPKVVPKRPPAAPTR